MASDKEKRHPGGRIPVSVGIRSRTDIKRIQSLHLSHHLSICSRNQKENTMLLRGREGKHQDSKSPFSTLIQVLKEKISQSADDDGKIPIEVEAPLFCFTLGLLGAESKHG